MRIIKYKNVFSKDYTENWSREIFIIDSVLKTNPWSYEIKDLNGEKNNRKFLRKKLLLSKIWLSYYPEPGNHIRATVKVVLSLSNYATK